MDFIIGGAEMNKIHIEKDKIIDVVYSSGSPPG